jgi:hypothetical protein
MTCIHMLPHTLYLRTTPPCRGELRRCHVSRDFGPHLIAEESSDVATCPSAPDLASLLRWAPMVPRVPWLQALLPRGESSSATTSLMAPSGLWTTGIKKDLAALVTQLGSRVSKARSCVIEAPVRCACYSAALQCSTGLADHFWTWL